MFEHCVVLVRSISGVFWWRGICLSLVLYGLVKFLADFSAIRPRSCDCCRSWWNAKSRSAEIYWHICRHGVSHTSSDERSGVFTGAPHLRPDNSGQKIVTHKGIGISNLPGYGFPTSAVYKSWKFGFAVFNYTSGVWILEGVYSLAKSFRRPHSTTGVVLSANYRRQLLVSFKNKTFEYFIKLKPF